MTLIFKEVSNLEGVIWCILKGMINNCEKRLVCIANCYKIKIKDMETTIYIYTR